MAGVVILLAACASTPAAGQANPPILDRAVMPPAGPTPEYDFPDIRRSSLSNGLHLWIVERPGLPLVAVQLVLGAGAVAEAPEQSGLASLTAEMLTTGTATRSAREIADQIEFLAAGLNAGAGRESSGVSLQTLSRNLEPALEIFADVVINPAFAADEWERVKAQRLAAILQARDQAATLATDLFGRVVYGASHPLGRSVQGTVETVTALTPESLRSFHGAFYSPRGAHLIVVGDVRTDQLIPLLERTLGGWSGPQVSAPPPVAEVSPGGAIRMYLVDRPGSAQSEIRIGHVGVSRSHPDYFPILLMNSILGGQFTSRINLNLREDKGYTYGARSAFEMGRLAGPFVASAGVHTAVTREAVVEFMRELEEIRHGRPVTDEEMEFAKARIIRGEPLTLETNAQIAGRIQQLILYDLPLDFFDEYNERIAAVTRSDVDRAAREYLRPDRFVILVVGDLAAIEESLRTLPYPVEVLTADPV